jgi:hypothetical protein
MAWAIVFRLADNEEDNLRSIRLALVDFVSDLSSPVDDIDPSVGGGENPLAKSRLFLRLLTDAGRWLAGD